MADKLDGFISHDLSAEQYREYLFPGGETVTIESPATLYLKADPKYRDFGGGSHRVIDTDGVAHYIPPGWICLVWENKPGLPRIQF